MANNPDNQSNNSSTAGGANPAADLIRQKINSIYGIEPDAIEEVEEVFAPHDKPLSKHQRYMQELTNSGKSLSDIQTEWHKYYAGLPDKDKHEVWQEFYSEHNKQLASDKTESKSQSGSFNLPKTDAAAVHNIQSVPDTPRLSHSRNFRRHNSEPRTVADIKDQLLGKANARAGSKLKAKQQFQSILFGMGMGSLVVVILLFSFFNDRFIAPFITPSKNVSSTPIIIDGSTASVDTVPKIIIPKINVEIPTVYDEPSVEEHAIQNALERGVVHYANTPSPGEKGNVVIFGHSSNNILNKGKYKFAFVLLNKLEIGDTFYLTKDKVRYAYRIYDKKIVKPTDLGVLNSTEKPSSVTLITCDPPGTSLNRLVVVGEQISPDPNNNKNSSVVASSSQPSIIPSNSESLWQRITSIFN